jgi:hypothetical protein
LSIHDFFPRFIPSEKLTGVLVGIMRGGRNFFWRCRLIDGGGGMWRQLIRALGKIDEGITAFKGQVLQNQRAFALIVLTCLFIG